MTREQGLEHKIADLVKRTATDPAEFPDLLATFNHLFGNANVPAQSNNLTEGITGTIENAMLLLRRQEAAATSARRIANMLERFPHPTLIVSQSGRVKAMNDSAISQSLVDVGESVDSLPFVLSGSERLSRLVERTLAKKEPHEHIALSSAFSPDDERQVTVAVVPTSRNAGKTANDVLVFLVDQKWRIEASTLMQCAYDLTDSEREILVAFMDGLSLTEIAKRRKRAHATVRTQFQSILMKCGAGTQAQLCRSAFGLSEFAEKMQEISRVASHPYRKRADILRPKGRTVETHVAGDFTGTPVIFLADNTLYTFPPAVESYFFDAGLNVISVCRPGFGETSNRLSADTYDRCLAQDVVAIQDQLGIGKCALLAKCQSTPSAIRLGSLIPERISEIGLLSPLLPRTYLNPDDTSAPWATALLHAADRSPLLLKFLAHSGIKAWKLMGSRRFVELQLGKNQRDVNLLEEPEVVAALEHAISSATVQGSEAIVEDLQQATTDWIEWADRCEASVMIFHGDEDPVIDIADVQRFVNCRPKVFKLTVLNGGGFLSHVTHTEQIFSRYVANG